MDPPRSAGSLPCTVYYCHPLKQSWQKKNVPKRLRRSSGWVMAHVSDIWDTSQTPSWAETELMCVSVCGAARLCVSVMYWNACYVRACVEDANASKRGAKTNTAGGQANQSAGILQQINSVFKFSYIFSSLIMLFFSETTTSGANCDFLHILNIYSGWSCQPQTHLDLWRCVVYPGSVTFEAGTLQIWPILSLEYRSLIWLTSLEYGEKVNIIKLDALLL